MRLDGDVPPLGISEVETWEFTADSFGNPGHPLGTWSIDPTKSPKQFDFQVDDDPPRQGVYELTGDELTICHGTSSGHRPSQIKAGYGTVLRRFRRGSSSTGM